MGVSNQERYKLEREKRLNSKGLGQYLTPQETTKYIPAEDPWIETGTPVNYPVPEGGHVKIAVFGAGIGGICSAVRAILEGSVNSADDLLIVDHAGGFGGTWYHNRYPGLMCDVESYIYIPLLEETGYMPKRKYAGGEEIRHALNLLAEKFGLHDRAMFQTRGKSLTWNESAKNWECEVLARPKGEASSKTFKFTADYIIISSGGFTDPKIPNLPGLEEFKGKMLHTGRWNYDMTGGSPSDPKLTGLEGLRVAVVGTGATAIQVVPSVAKHAKELYVLQRTASAVDERGNRDTDVGEWKDKIANKKGWQEERSRNFQLFTEGVENLPEVDMVGDGMSRMPTLSGAWGGSKAVEMDQVGGYLEEMNGLDGTRSDRVRQRVLDVVKDQETALALQAWYPGWCKRPTFHDDYLAAFNLPNVHLLDTGGKGLQTLTPSGLSHDGKEYPIDLIIWASGYGNPLSDSLAGKAGITVLGKQGQNMESRFKTGKLMTLHGTIAQHFPNLFYTGLSQAGVGVNQTQRLDQQAIHIAHTIREAEIKTGGGGKATIEPTEAACEDWANRVAGHAHKLSTMAGCTPSYFNAEGEADKMSSEQQAGAARGAIWGQGYLDYERILKEWRGKGDLEGFVVEAV